MYQSSSFSLTSEQQWSQMSGGPGGDVLQQALGQEAGPAEQVHEGPHLVQPWGPHQWNEQHSARRQ